jgi:hypothetical protein
MICVISATAPGELTNNRNGVKGGKQISHGDTWDWPADISATKNPASSKTNIGLTAFCAEALSRANAPSITVAEP